MARGGKRPGAGRKKGSGTTKTKKTNALAARAAGEGPLPLEVMLAAMRDHYEAGRFDRAAAVAKDAAPYLHPRLSAVQVSGGPVAVRLRLVEEIVAIDSSQAEAPADGDAHANGQAAPGPG